MTSGEGVKKPVRVARVEVLRGHMVCTVRFAVGVPRVTSPQLMALVLPQFPNLPRHACVNERGETFAAVMNRTPLPHLLEHMIVDLQVREMAKGADASEGLGADAGAAADSDAAADAASVADPGAAAGANQASGAAPAAGHVAAGSAAAKLAPRASRIRRTSAVNLNASIVGTSEWLDESAGVARIDVSFTDDHIALRALRDAVAVMNSLFSS